jgi:hypothetical protein
VVYSPWVDARPLVVIGLIFFAFAIDVIIMAQRTGDLRPLAEVNGLAI